MSHIKTTKLGRVVKKLFNRRNVLFSVGLILVVLGAIIWIVNFSFIKPKSAKAATVSGDFYEDWTATEMWGMVRYRNQDSTANGTFDTNNASAWLATTVARHDTNVWNNTMCGGPCRATNGVANYLPNFTNGAYWVGWHDNSRDIDMIGVLGIDVINALPVATKWHVDGHVTP